MIVGLTTGKALLVITRMHSEIWPDRFTFEVTPYIQSCSGNEWAREAAKQDFTLLNYDILSAPRAAYKLKVGDKIRVHVVYEFAYTRDYWGEDDVELVYHKEKVLRRQPLKKRNRAVPALLRVGFFQSIHEIN